MGGSAGPLAVAMHREPVSQTIEALRACRRPGASFGAPASFTQSGERRKMGKKREKGSEDATLSVYGLASKKPHDSLSERRSSPNTPRYGSKIRYAGSGGSTWWRRNSSSSSTPGSFSPPVSWFALQTPMKGPNEPEDALKATKDPNPWKDGIPSAPDLFQPLSGIPRDGHCPVRKGYEEPDAPAAEHPGIPAVRTPREFEDHRGRAAAARSVSSSPRFSSMASICIRTKSMSPTQSPWSMSGTSVPSR